LRSIPPGNNDRFCVIVGQYQPLNRANWILAFVHKVGMTIGILTVPNDLLACAMHWLSMVTGAAKQSNLAPMILGSQLCQTMLAALASSVSGMSLTQS